MGTGRDAITDPAGRDAAAPVAAQEARPVHLRHAGLGPWVGRASPGQDRVVFTRVSPQVLPPEPHLSWSEGPGLGIEDGVHAPVQPLCDCAGCVTMGG